MKSDVDGLELRESPIAGAGTGVFATADITEDTFLPVKPRGVTVGVDRKEADIPKEHLEHCIARGNGMYHGPADFDDMELVWYMNHSSQPNAQQRQDGYYSLRPIKAGEEILIDYNTLGEPEDKKDNFYKGSDNASPLEIAQLYFELSNKSDFDGIAKLFTDSTTYSSRTTGDYLGAGDILTMQKAYHGKFKTLKWTVNSVEENNPGVIQFDYDFSGETKDGEKVRSSGLEYVTAKGGKITRIEIRNKE